MSSENPTKKRRIVKKLDFENCVVTNVRTKARTKRKLRAKLTREVEDIEESPEKEDQSSPTRSPVLSQKTRFVRQTSPVLMRTPTQRRKSPVLLSKRKTDFVNNQTREKLNTETNSLRKSPVFKVKTSKWKSRNATTTTTTTTTSQKGTEQATSQRISGSDTENSYQIDDFTQDSKQNVEISSIESEQDVHSTLSLEPLSTTPDTTGESSELLLSDTCPRFVYDSPERMSDLKESVRKNFKKNSLLGRLEKLGRKQASEKLLWQHQRQRKIITDLKKLSVISFWNEESNFVLKCQSLSPDSDEVNFLFVNSQWVPSVKRIKRGSVLRLYPPWQKVSVAGLGADVLLSVICLEILGEENNKMVAASPPAAATDKIRFESLPLYEYETNEKLFVDSLFSSYTSSFLY